MKHLFTLFLFLTSVLTMNAQSVSLFDVDASGFPTVKAKFYAFDAANKQQRPSKSELTITENGQPRTITSVTCPPDTIKSLSVCIMVDTYGYGLIKLAQAGTQRLINYLQPPNDEIAITMMNKGVQIHQDFTSDMAKATLGASSIPPAPGYVDVQKMFYNPYTGGVPFISGRVSDKKVLILVSDLHCPNLNLDTARLYQDAAQHNISVYSVLLGTTDYSGLFKRVAAKTGGQVFEMVRTEKQITNIFQEIERREHYIPCDITWESEPSCKSETDVEFSWQGRKSSEQYTILASAIANIIVKPLSVNMGKRLPTSQNDTILTLTAQNSDFTVTGISRRFGSAEFYVVNTTFPFTILKDSSRTITLRFAPSDSGMQYASFELFTDICDYSFSSYGGFPGKKMTTPTLKLTYPNGGESFVVGKDTVINWSGIASSDTVSLDFSNNGGATWQRISNKASGLTHVWKNIPSPPSSQCLMRVRQNGDSEIRGDCIFILSGHFEDVMGVTFSPDGSKIVTASYDLTAKIWDPNTGNIIQTLHGHTGYISGVAFSPDGSKIVTGGDNTARIWNASNGLPLQTLNGHTDRVFGVAYSSDGSKVATASFDKTAKIWDVTTGIPLQTLVGHIREVVGITFSPDGSKIVTTSYDNTIKIWDVKTGGRILSFTGHINGVYGVAFSPDGSKIVTVGGDYNAVIRDVHTGNALKTLIGHKDRVWGVAYSPDGTRIATVSGDTTAKIWDANTGALLKTLKGHSDYVYGVAFSPDGSRIATSSTDDTARIWDVDYIPFQADTSDAVFSIIAPEPTLQNLSIDMGKVLVGQSKDSTVLGIICNKGSAPLHVLGIDITSGDSTNFTIPRGAGDFFLDSNECRDVMFGFSPTKVGARRAKATIRTTVGDFIDTISIIGEGIAPALAIVNPFIDFGKTLVGTPKDTSKVVTIKNVGTSDLTITQTDYNAVNTTNFSTINGGNSFTLQPNMEAIMDLRFLPFDVGRRSGILQFHYNGIGSPATVQLFGEGIINIPDTARTTVIAQDITAQAGEKVNLSLKLYKPSGMNVIGAPTEWFARIHYNKSILFNEQTSNVCSGTTDSCVLELTGVYNPKSDELLSISCIATLGNTDHSTIVIDTFYWTNSAIVTDVATQNGTIKITGVCEDGGVRLFIPAQNSTSLSSRPNPAQDKLQIQYGLREPLTVTLELLTMTGQVVQTIMNNQAQAEGQYTLTNDLHLLGNGVYLLRLRTNKEMLTTRVDVVK